MSLRSPLTILLIDDDAEDRLLYRCFLEEDTLYTYRIFEFETTTEAMAWCQQEIPDVILLDFLLPDGDGLVFLQQFREKFDRTQSAAIMLTGYGDETIAVQAMKNDAQDYLIKSKLTGEALQRAIHHAVERTHLTFELQQSRELQLIGNIALRIRQSLKLEEILQTTTTEVRQFLQADRVLVYQFSPDMSGIIVAESVLPGWSVALGRYIEDTCFKQGVKCNYQLGEKRANNDIYQAGLTKCHLQLLEQFEVKANLVVPILETNQLWGLLIVHQCATSRHWKQVEINLLEQLGVQIAIAIQQATAYEQLQTELIQRKQVEVALQESKEIFHQLAQTVEEIFLIQNADFSQTIYISPRYEYIWQRSPEELYQNPGAWLESIYPEDREGLCREIQRVISGEKCQTECRILRHCGELRWILVQAFPVFDDSGKIYRTIISAQDITDVYDELRLRKQAEEERLRSEMLQIELQLVEDILETAQAGYWEWNIPNNVGYLSLTFKQMFGYGEQELENPSESWQSLIFTEDLPGFLEYFQQNIQNPHQIPSYQELRYRHKNGSPVWTICSSRVIEWDKDDNPLRIIGCNIDITKSKESEEQLRQLSDRLTLAIKSGGFGIWEWDVLHDVLIWDDRMYELYGIQASEFIGRYEAWIMGVHPSDRAEVEAFNQRVQQGKIEYDCEFRFIHPDGSIRFIKAYAIMKRDSQGESQRMVGINYDITERKLAEQELIRSRDLQEVIFNESADALFLVDPVTLLTLECNQRAVELFGAVNKSELIGIPGHMLQRQEFTPEELFAINLEMLTEGFWSREIEYITYRGNYFWGNIAAKSITVGGRSLNLVRLTDISDRKQAEEQLKLTNEQLAQTNTELARATQLKDEFLANMSHELRTPLNAILGMAEGLQEGVFASLNERQAKAIATIERSGRHLLELINEILDLSKIESGKLELLLSDVSVENLCNFSLVFVRQMAFKKNINLSTNIVDNLGNIQVDDCRLRQVLINLLSNAIKFTPEGGNVKLKVWLEESKSSPYSLLCFSVTDTGIGIAPENMNKLFQPFIQLDSKLNRHYHGTGLGLSLVKRITALHGGTVSVSSEVGKGSCFTVSIPYHTSPQLQPTQEELKDDEIFPQQPALEAPVILLAEDNQATIDTISSYLESRGYRLILATNGQQAIDFAVSSKPDLIVMDIQMPVMDGLEAIRHIRKQQLVSVPIIALTALAMSGDRETCLLAGANEYLTKPVKLKQLVATIQKLLTSSKHS
jgi:PAS domain S-box-containing protein